MLVSVCLGQGSVPVSVCLCQGSVPVNVCLFCVLERVCTDEHESDRVSSGATLNSPNPSGVAASGGLPWRKCSRRDEREQVDGGVSLQLTRAGSHSVGWLSSECRTNERMSLVLLISDMIFFFFFLIMFLF